VKNKNFLDEAGKQTWFPWHVLTRRCRCGVSTARCRRPRQT